MSSLGGSYSVRPAHDSDSEAAMAIMERVYADYGFVFAIDEELPEMRRVASAFADADGRFWVAEAADRIVVGIVGCMLGEEPMPDRVPIPFLELKRLYVSPDFRRNGIGAALVGQVEAEAVHRGLACVALWSDTRLPDGHRLYERCGFTRTDVIRDLRDLSNSREILLWKRVG